VKHGCGSTGKLYTLDSSYGSKDELVSLVRALKEAGIDPIADIVINHRCAQEQDDSGVWNSFS
jgi:alpha-amylase